jgi:hypothetical protein
VYGPVERGGLGLPDIYTTQGIDKLHIFFGHLCLNDETGKLIKIDLGYVQLIVGSSKLFLNTDHTKYSWIDTGWLKSLWEFTYLVNLQFALPSNWLPSTPREHDIFFMEYLQTLRLSSKQMDLLNQCDMYLQVIMLADIVSAVGTYILPEAKQGNQLTGRKS